MNALYRYVYLFYFIGNLSFITSSLSLSLCLSLSLPLTYTQSLSLWLTNSSHNSLNIIGAQVFVPVYVDMSQSSDKYISFKSLPLQKLAGWLVQWLGRRVRGEVEG